MVTADNFSLTDKDVEEAFYVWSDENHSGPITLGDAWMILEAFEAGFLAAKKQYGSINFDQQHAQQLI